MPKIIGEKLRDYVVDQIKARQEAHGSGTDGNTRTLNQLTYLNSKTAWVKLASGIKITPERLGPTYENLRDRFVWESLARHHVLFGGLSELDQNVLKPRGTYNTTSDGFNIWNNQWGVYNVNASNNASSEFGLVPMPGIASAEVKCLNRGSIKKATVNVKCYSPEQFQIIDLLYLRIGYTMFLEWGNSLYLSNDDSDKLTRMGYTLTESDQGFFSPDSHKLSHLGFLPKIEKYRENKDGNYDGLLCKVTNFNWTFSQDGSYDINIELISLGDVVESLKLNIAPAYEVAKFIDEAYKIYNEDTSQNEEAAEINPPSPSDNWISAYLFLQKLSVDEDYNSSGGYDANERFDLRDAIAGNITSTGTTLELGGVFVKPPTELTIEVEDPLSITETVLAAAVPGVGTAVSLYDAIWGFTKPVTITPTVEGDQEKKDVVHFAYNRGEDDEDQTIIDSEFYMRLGHLLQFISSYVIPVVEKDQDSPLLIIDYDQWGNKMYTLPYQVSLDPRVCIVNAAVEPINSKEFFPNLVDWKYISSDQSEAYGWTMNIYVNHAQILSSLEDAKNDEGDVNVFEFLSSLCTAINKAMGGINNLEPVYDEDSHTISIIDGSYAPPSKPNYVLDLYGYNINDKNSSTFVRNFSLKTEITNDFATMATIGSTAGGYTKGVENTMFSKWNKGLIDPWKEKITPPKKSRDKGSDQEEPNKLYVSQFWNGRYSAWGYTLLDQTNDIGSDYAGIDDSIIEKNLTTVKNFFQHCQSKIQQEQEKYASPTNGFVPISLGLTMDGISGIKIYNEINVDTRFLPKNYSDNLRFIIKGVNHKLSNSDWETSIETVVISQSGDKNQPPLPYSKIKEIIDREITSGVQSLGATSGGSSTGSITASTPPVVTAGVGGIIDAVVGLFTGKGSNPWKVWNKSKYIQSAYELNAHHSQPVNEKDSKNTRSGGWTKTKSGKYVYDVCLFRKENGVLQNKPFVPSPVNGTVIRTNPDGSGNSFLSIQGDDGLVYDLLHMDNYQVKKGDRVTRGQLIARQSNVSPPNYANHLHIQFPSKNVLIDYIDSLVNDRF
jgi:hypothetical protein